MEDVNKHQFMESVNNPGHCFGQNELMFERVWLECLGYVFLDLLSFSDLIKLTETFPVVCDSLFHGSPLSKQFMKRYWTRVALHKNDFVQSHDCHELIYKQFAQWSHTPSTCLLPLPTEGFYPVEPYLAWRVVSLLLHGRRLPTLGLMFYWSPQIASIIDFEIPFNRLTFVDIVSDSKSDYPLCAYNTEIEPSDAGSLFEGIQLTKRDVLALVFELLMTSWYDISIFGTDYCEGSILQVPDSKHRILPHRNGRGASEFVTITNRDIIIK